MNSLPIYKKSVTEEKLHASLTQQMAELPDSGLEMTPAEMCEKIRAFLWNKEMTRIHGTKNIPLYPMEWEVRDAVSLLGAYA